MLLKTVSWCRRWMIHSGRLMRNATVLLMNLAGCWTETCSSNGQRFVTSSYGRIGCPFRAVCASASWQSTRTLFIARFCCRYSCSTDGMLCHWALFFFIYNVRRQKQQQPGSPGKEKDSRKSSRQICSNSSCKEGGTFARKKRQKRKCIYLKKKGPSILRRTRELGQQDGADAGEAAQGAPAAATHTHLFLDKY